MLPAIQDVMLDPPKAPCISIIVSFGFTQPHDRSNIAESLSAASRKAKEIIHAMTDKEQMHEFEGYLREALDELHFDQLAAGAGIYFSPGFSYLAWFHFPVQDSITAGNEFRLRELRYSQYISGAYYVLQLSQAQACLYLGHCGRLKIADKQRYPMIYTDDHEYSRPAQVSARAGYAGVKGFEKDDPALHNIRLQAFLEHTDQLLNIPSATPLILAGPVKAVSLFSQVTRHRHAIAGKIFACFDNTPIRDLEIASWNALQHQREEKEHHAILDLVQAKWRNMAAEGPEQVWRAARSKQILHLLVEKDFEISAVEDREGRLHTRLLKDARHIPQVAETIIRSIGSTGKVTFVLPGQLEGAGHIAAILKTTQARKQGQ